MTIAVTRPESLRSNVKFKPLSGNNHFHHKPLILPNQLPLLWCLLKTSTIKGETLQRRPNDSSQSDNIFEDGHQLCLLSGVNTFNLQTLQPQAKYPGYLTLPT